MATRGKNGLWQWGRTAQTQRALLDAARQVFTEHGFTEANIADIVERAGSSVGSLYHHFGGKGELYIALWQEHQLSHEVASRMAVADAKKNGVTDPAQLFETGTRAFLNDSWEQRDLVLLFHSGDAPAGFELMRRGKVSDWLNQNDSLLHLADTPVDRMYASILTSVIREGVDAVSLAKRREEADEIINALIGFIRRLMSGGPWRPDST